MISKFPSKKISFKSLLRNMVGDWGKADNFSDSFDKTGKVESVGCDLKGYYNIVPY